MISPALRQARDNLKEAQESRNYYRGLVRDARRSLRDLETRLAVYEAAVVERLGSLFVVSGGAEGQADERGSEIARAIRDV